MPSGDFVCVCTPKSLELGADEHFHRKNNTAALETLLATVAFTTTPSSVHVLPGGGVAADPGVQTAVSGNVLVAFCGSLENYAYLFKKFCLAEVACSLDDSCTLNEVNAAAPVTEAELIALLYKQLGTTMLPKLRGEFTFVCYDSKTARVLAARSCCGGLPLLQARNANGCLVIASQPECLPDHCHTAQEILPGHYKYGWYSEPQQFATPVQGAGRTAAEASAAAKRALLGLTGSEDPPARAKGKTRRGKRGGVKQRMLREMGRGGLRERLSLDSQKAAASRADEDTWWRRTSLDEEMATSPTYATSPTSRAFPMSPLTEEQEGVQEAVPVVHQEPSSTPQKQSPFTNIPHHEVLSELPADMLEKLAGPYKEDAASVRMLANLLYSSPCALSIVDAGQEDMPIVYVNRVFEIITHYASEEVLGQNCRFLQAPPGAARVPSFASMSIKKAMQSGQSKTVRILNYRKDGTAMWNNLSVVPLRNNEGTVTHFVGMQTFLPADGVLNEAEAGVAKSLRTKMPLLKRRNSLIRAHKSCSDLEKLGTLGAAGHALPSLAY